jgi:hypothetical protein
MSPDEAIIWADHLVGHRARVSRMRAARLELGAYRGCLLLSWLKRQSGMNPTFAVVALAALASAVVPVAARGEATQPAANSVAALSIIPAPREVSLGSGAFRVTART